MAKSSQRITFRSLICIAFVFIALSVIAIGLTIWGLRSDAIRDANSDTSNIAIMLSEELTRSIQSVDIVLTDVSEYLQSKNATNENSFPQRIRSREFYDLLGERLARLSQAGFIAVVDREMDNLR